MQTIETFYKSKQWQRLIRILKQERIDEEGFIICEHCGEPIVKKYDCIGHHKVELTTENVNDPEIALNPELIALVHHKCHNEEHERFGSKRQQVFIVYGSPLSGKSSYVRSVAAAGDLIVDMDSIWQCISGLERYRKPNRLKNIVFDVRNKLIEEIKFRRGHWRNAYIIGGYPLIGERQRLIKELGAEEIFIDTTKQECLNRMYYIEDARKDLDYEAFIEKWWREYAPTQAEI